MYQNGRFPAQKINVFVVDGILYSFWIERISILNAPPPLILVAVEKNRVIICERAIMRAQDWNLLRFMRYIDAIDLYIGHENERFPIADLVGVGGRQMMRISGLLNIM